MWFQRIVCVGARHFRLASVCIVRLKLDTGLGVSGLKLVFLNVCILDRLGFFAQVMAWNGYGLMLF